MSNTVFNMRMAWIHQQFQQQGFVLGTDIAVDQTEAMATTVKAIRDAQEDEEEWKSHQRSRTQAIQDRGRFYVCTPDALIPIIEIVYIHEYAVITEMATPPRGSWELVFTNLREDADIEALPHAHVFEGTIGPDEGGWLDLVAFLRNLMKNLSELWDFPRPSSQGHGFLIPIGGGGV